jgi:hypothetical protein
MQLTQEQKQIAQTQFYISVLDQFATNGDELLNVLDDIKNGDVVWFDPSSL